MHLVLLLLALLASALASETEDSVYHMLQVLGSHAQTLLAFTSQTLIHSFLPPRSYPSSPLFLIPLQFFPNLPEMTGRKVQPVACTLFLHLHNDTCAISRYDTCALNSQHSTPFDSESLARCFWTLVQGEAIFLLKCIRTSTLQISNGGCSSATGTMHLQVTVYSHSLPIHTEHQMAHHQRSNSLHISPSLHPLVVASHRWLVW